MCLAFFLIVPSVIIVTIFLVHAIAQKIGFKVKYFSLILCAVLSLAVNAAAIEMSTYLDKFHYVRLGILILVASIIVTFVNRYLIKHEKTDVIIVTDAEIEEELALEAAEIETEENKKAIIKAKEEKLTEEEKPIKIKKPIENKIAEKPKIEEKVIEKSEEIKKPEIKKEEKPIEKFVEIKKSKDEITSETKVAATKFLKPAEKKEEKVTKPISKPTSKPIIEKPKLNVEKPQEKKLPLNEEKISEIDKHIGSLDDILDYAYSQKTKGNLNQAVIAYQKALNRYKNDDYAPFIAIDLGNIYKEQAAYTKVIKTYEEALKLPAVVRNANTRKEFEKNLTYVKILQSILIRHRALTMPFSKIPRQYIQEADTEFKSLQLNSSTSKRKL